jgi:hypothetical protein
VKGLTWIDEEATFSGPLPNPGKWHGGKNIVAISTPKGGSLVFQPERLAPRWRKDLRRTASLSTPVGQGEIPFQCIQLDQHTIHEHEFQMQIDGIRWRGRWVMLDVRVDHHVEQFHSFHDPFPKKIKTGPSTMTISLQNLEAPGQKVTFELQGAWDLHQDTGTGRYTIKRQKPAEMKPAQKGWIPWE